MTTIDTEVRAALGLGEEALLEPKGRFVGPRSPDGRGLATQRPLSSVVDAFLEAPHAAELVRDGAPGNLRRWPPEPGVFLLEIGGLGVRQTGGSTHALSEEELALDARGEACFVRLTGPHLDVVWRLTADAAECLEVRAPERALPGSSDARLSQPGEPEVVELTTPPFDVITGGPSPAPWLQEAYEALAASPSLVDRAAAVGHLARFHAPVPSTRLTVEQLLALHSPGRAARAWRSSLPEATQDALVMLSVSRVSELVDALIEVREALISEAPDARRLARAWVAERDRLESVRALFGRDAQVLKDALEQLDANVAIHHSLWNLVEAWVEDPLLREVAWREPDAWWGRLCGN